MNIIIFGNPSDGFEYIGPFATHEDAMQYMENDRDLRQRDAWIAPMHLPDTELTKSGMVKELAKSLGLKCVDIPMVQVEPGDLVGFLQHNELFVPTGVPGKGKSGTL